MTYRIRRYGKFDFALRLDDGRSDYFGQKSGDFYISAGKTIWREAGLRKLESLGLCKLGSGKRAPTISDLMAGGTMARAA